MRFDILVNWPLVIASVAVIVVAIISVLNFIQKPSDDQIQSVREWLLFACVQAERALGSGTGKLKLRYVYDMFLEKFPYIAKFLTFDTFSQYVDEALEKMKELLNTNERVKEYVGE